MICTFTSEIFCECSVERLRSHETVVRICDDHPLALHSPDTDIDFEKGVPCEAFRNLLKGKKITRAAITLGKHSARWIHIEPPCKAEIHFRMLEDHSARRTSRTGRRLSTTASLPLGLVGTSPRPTRVPTDSSN